MPWVCLKNIFGATVRPISRYWSTLKIILWLYQVPLTVQENKDSITPLTFSKNDKTRYFRERAVITVGAFQNLLYKRLIILGYLSCYVCLTKIHTFDSAICFMDTILFTFFPSNNALFTGTSYFKLKVESFIWVDTVIARIHSAKYRNFT